MQNSRYENKPGAVVLRISGDGELMTEGFWGLKFSIPGFFVGKFGWLDLSMDFLGIQNHLKIRARE